MILGRLRIGKRRLCSTSMPETWPLPGSARAAPPPPPTAELRRQRCHLGRISFPGTGAHSSCAAQRCSSERECLGTCCCRRPQQTQQGKTSSGVEASVPDQRFTGNTPLHKACTKSPKSSSGAQTDLEQQYNKKSPQLFTAPTQKELKRLLPLCISLSHSHRLSCSLNFHALQSPRVTLKGYSTLIYLARDEYMEKQQVCNTMMALAYLMGSKRD